MALLHDATVTPSKLELLNAWLPSRSWFEGGGDVERVAAYRLDDPAGEVGLEGFLVTEVNAEESGTYHVPLTYRAAPLDGADAYLVGTMEHSVLGARWVYDACGDPVWASVLATTIRTGGRQAEQYFEVDGKRMYRDPPMTVQGSGSGSDVVDVSAVQARDAGATTVMTADGLEVALVRRTGSDVEGDLVLTGTWPGATGPIVLAALRQPAD
jgi:hypothetical protein